MAVPVNTGGNNLSVGTDSVTFNLLASDSASNGIRQEIELETSSGALNQVATHVSSYSAGGTTGNQSLSFTISGLSSGTTYFWDRRLSCTAGNVGAWEAGGFPGQFTTSTPNTAPTTPGAFTSPTAGQSVDKTVTIAWGASTDAQGNTIVYEVDLSLNNGGSWTTIRNFATGTSFVYDFTNTAPTSQAKLRVRASDGSLTSGYTESGVFTVAHTPYVPRIML